MHPICRTRRHRNRRDQARQMRAGNGYASPNGSVAAPSPNRILAAPGVDSGAADDERRGLKRGRLSSSLPTSPPSCEIGFSPKSPPSHPPNEAARLGKQSLVGQEHPDGGRCQPRRGRLRAPGRLATDGASAQQRRLRDQRLRWPNRERRKRAARLEQRQRRMALRGASADAPRREPTGSPSHEQSPGIDKSVLALPEPKRHRNKEHLRFVAQQACLVCGRKPSDPHHLRFTQPRALGRKVSDEFAVPLCRSHHRALHRVGNEVGWWKADGHRSPQGRAQALGTQPADRRAGSPAGAAWRQRIGREILAANSGDVGQPLSEPPIAESCAGDG